MSSRICPWKRSGLAVAVALSLTCSTTSQAAQKTAKTAPAARSGSSRTVAAAPGKPVPSSSSAPTTASGGGSGGRSPASMGSMGSGSGVHEAEKPLKVTGQSRNINMLLVLKGDKDQLNFVKPRKNFQDKTGEAKF